MISFKIRLQKISQQNGKIILANDYDFSIPNVESKLKQNIKKLHSYICGIKLNFHVLLPLSMRQISKINSLAHNYGLQTIADIKLNDIGNTNKITIETLYHMGFDAVIVNPIMGFASLKNLINFSHKNGHGIITLCHMSAPEATSYDMRVFSDNKKVALYELFLDWAMEQKADGIIVGATFPKIIEFCKQKSKGKISIFSPGVGTQGGDIKKVVKAGTDYLIVGRTILNSKDPIQTALKLKLECL